MKTVYLRILIILSILFLVSCADNLDLQGNLQNGKIGNFNGSLTVSFALCGEKGVYTNYMPVIYAKLTLTGPDSQTLVKEWNPGDPTVLSFSSSVSGEHTLSVIEVLSNFTTNSDSVVFYMLEGYNYYITVYLDGVYVSSNANDGTLDPYDTNMVLIEGGTFTYSQGSIPVTLAYDMYVARYETTFDEWLVYYHSGVTTNLPDDNGWGHDRMPLINVSWYDALNYCNWKSMAAGLKPAYDGYARLLDTNGQVTSNLSAVEGYRLMTEWEWEYVAREKGTASCNFAGSDNIDPVGWWSGNSSGMSHGVGSKTPTLQGCYDMTGNVSEWCFNEPTIYTGSQTNPAGNNSQYQLIKGEDITITGVIVPIEIPVTKIYRGGSYADTTQWGYFFLLIDTVIGDYSTNRDLTKGFRVIRTRIL